SAPLGSIGLRTDAPGTYLKVTSGDTGWAELGTLSASLAAIAFSGSATDLVAGTVPAARMPALTGDVTTSAGSVATTISANVVTNAKLATAAAYTVKGNATSSTANVTDIAATAAGQ